MRWLPRARCGLLSDRLRAGCHDRRQLNLLCSAAGFDRLRLGVVIVTKQSTAITRLVKCYTSPPVIRAIRPRASRGHAGATATLRRSNLARCLALAWLATVLSSACVP